MFDLPEEDQLTFTRYIMSLLDDWNVKPADQITLLDLPKDIRPRSLRKYSDNTCFPNYGTLEKRVAHLYGIGQALHTTYPRNQKMGARWMHQKNRHFTKITPIGCMLKDGLRGLQRVRAHLDCTYAWDLTGSSPN